MEKVEKWVIGAGKKIWLTPLGGMSIKEGSRATNSKEKGVSSQDSPNMSTTESSQLANPIVKTTLTQSTQMSFAASWAQTPATHKKSSKEIALSSSHNP